MLNSKHVRLFLFATVICFCHQGWLWAQDSTSASPDVLPSIDVERLSNGIRVIRLPVIREAPGSIALAEIAFGYRAGVRNEYPYPEGVAAVLASYLSVSTPARSIALAAHMSGGTFQIIDEADLVGMRVRVPVGAVDSVLRQIVAFFAEDELRTDILEHARQSAIERSETVSEGELDGIDQAVRSSLLGEHPDVRPRFGRPSAMEEINAGQLQSYFDDALGTDRAYVILSDPAPAEWIEALGGVDARTSVYTPPAVEPPELTETELRFPSETTGGVILGTLLPSVHFEAWYGMLVVDRALRRNLAPAVGSSFGLSAQPSLHRIEARVEIPLYAEEVRDSVFRVIRNLQSQSLGTSELGMAKIEALDYLGSRPVLEWFAAQDLWGPLENGWTRIRNLTDEQFRAAARDFDLWRRVVAIWPPSFGQPRVTVDDLDASVPEEASEGPRLVRAVPGRIVEPALPDLLVPDSVPVEVETLASGVTLAVGSPAAVFVAGRFDAPLPGGQRVRAGTNGVLWEFRESPGPESLAPLSAVRPDRILFFVPVVELSDARDRYAGWVSGETDSSASLSAGEIATADMPSVVVLKMWLDSRIIEAGWWGQAEVRIDGVEGSSLVIDADPQRAQAVRDWISELAEGGLPNEEFLRVRNAAMGYFERIRRELQIILWQRAPSGIIRPPNTVTPARLLDVARVYF